MLNNAKFGLLNFRNFLLKPVKTIFLKSGFFLLGSRRNLIFSLFWDAKVDLYKKCDLVDFVKIMLKL